MFAAIGIRDGCRQVHLVGLVAFIHLNGVDQIIITLSWGREDNLVKGCAIRSCKGKWPIDRISLPLHSLSIDFLTIAVEINLSMLARVHPGK